MNYLDYTLDLEDATIWNIISATAVARPSLLYMIENGDFFARGNYYTTRQGQGEFLIKLTLSGTGILKYDGQEYLLQPDDLFFIDCRQWQHYATAPGSDNWRVLWVYFNGATAETYYNLFLKYTGGSHVLSLPRDSVVHNLMNRLLHLYDDDNLDHIRTDIRCSGYLTQLLTECISMATSTQKDNFPPVIEEIREYLEKNYTKKVTLEDLSCRFYLNPQYLQKLFKRYTSQSPAEYLTFLRITKAKELIRTTDMPLKSIAACVGIERYSYFYSLFKKHEGVTPTEYMSLGPSIKR